MANDTRWPNGLPQVIELQGAEGTKWGISFDGPNPEEADYVRMVDGETAFKLKALLEKFFPA